MVSVGAVTGGRTAGTTAATAAEQQRSQSTATAVNDANAALCTDLTAYGTAVKDLAALDPTTATEAGYTSAG